MASEVEIYDTTLRDGTQSEGLSLSAGDKLRLIRALDDFGIDYIEAGFPGSNPKDVELFARVSQLSLSHAKIVAFGATRHPERTPESDSGLAALLAAETEVCTLFGKSWRLHVDDVLRISEDDNLRLIEDSLAYLARHGRRVFFDAEHFFDGFTAEPEFALRVLGAALSGGASRLVLCDTNGGKLPWEVHEIVCAVRDRFPQAVIGIHAHNDTECAVANSLAAVQAGARQVQGTINGFGERCGNGNLCSILPSLELKLDLRCLQSGKLSQLRELARLASEVCNTKLNPHAAYVGRSAFAHKGGVHVSAMRRSIDSYQHVDPARVGNVSRVLVSELSGRSNLVTKAEEFGLKTNAAEAAVIVNQIKLYESQGFAFEAAEASVALLIKRAEPTYAPPFNLTDFQVTVGKRGAAEPFSEATVRVQVDGDTVHTAGSGNGPVSALDQALRKALAVRYPQLSAVTLSGYKVRILNEDAATGAITRVLITHDGPGGTFSTVGASTNIIAASLLALIDGLEFALLNESGSLQTDSPRQDP